MIRSKRSLNDKIDVLTAVGLVVGTWIVIPIPTLGFGLPKLIVFAVAACIASLSLLYSDQGNIFSRLLKCRVGRWFSLFALISLLSVFWSRAPIVSLIGAVPRFEGALTIAMYFSFALSAMALSQTVRGRTVAIRALITTNAGVCIYGLLQLLQIDPLGRFWGAEVFLGRLFSLLGQPNALGLFLVLTIPFLLVSIAGLRGKQHKLAIALLLLNALILFASVSRSAVLGLAVAIPLGIFWRQTRGAVEPLSRKQRSIALGLTILFVGIAMYFSAQRFANPTESGRSVDSRIVIWDGSVKMINLWPFGYGHETMGLFSSRFIGAGLLEHESLTSRIDRAHSQPLDLLISIGVFGLLAYYVFLYLLLRAIWLQRKQEGSRWFLAGGMSIVAASIALLFGFHSIATGVWFWFIVGLMIGPLLPESPDSKDSSIIKRVPLLVIILLNILLIVVCSRWISARLKMEQGEQWFNANELAPAVQFYATAAEEFPYDRILLTQAVETDLIALERSENQQTTNILHALAESHLQMLDTLTRQEDGMSFLLQAWLAAIDGQSDSVDYLVLQAALKQPDAVSTYRIAVHAYKILGNQERVEQTYDSLISILPAAWKDPSSPAGRIIWKEHPWLSEVEKYATERAKVPVN